MGKIKKDCFGYRNPERCGVLSEMVCKNKNCSFYKSKEQFIKDRVIYGNIQEIDKC